jgi:hypothetical protein
MEHHNTSSESPLSTQSNLPGPEPGITQFVLLSLEAWERLHSLDRLLEDEKASKCYYNLLCKIAGHNRRMNFKTFKSTKLLFGPQALVLLFPVIGFLQKLDEESKDDCESILEQVGLGMPSEYEAELIREGINESIDHPRREMVKCIRNAAAHHMENSLSLQTSTNLSIEMPSDGKHLIMRSKDFRLSFKKKLWEKQYVRLLHYLGQAARRILR